MNKQCELSNTRRYSRALRTRLTPAPSKLKSSREWRTGNREQRTEANVWLASLCCCLLSNKLVLHAEYLPLCMCVSVCVWVCMYVAICPGFCRLSALFARIVSAGRGARSCHSSHSSQELVSILPSPVSLLHSPLPIPDSAWHSCKTHKSAHSVLSARQRLLYSYYVPYPPCSLPPTQSAALFARSALFSNTFAKNFARIPF